MSGAQVRRDLRRIKELVFAGLYRFSTHAWDEMDEDGVFDDDVLHAIERCRTIVRLTDDPRGTRYVLRGPTLDGRGIEIVCRIVRRSVRIITVYLVD